MRTREALAAALCASLLTVTSVPCMSSAAAPAPAHPTDAAFAEPEEDGAVAKADPHHTGTADGSRAHHPGAAATTAADEDAPRLGAACTCGCEDASDAGANAFSRIGFALRSALRDAALPERIAWFAPAIPSMPVSPDAAIDPVPI